MATTANTDVSVRFGAEWVGQKGIKDAKNGITDFTKQVKLLRNSFIALKIVEFGKESVAAFKADQKSALAFDNTLKNLNLTMTGMAAENWIDRLSMASGIMSDKLRPAFQDLIRATGDYTKSQELLNTAINTSRSSGADLETVANDIAQAYVGNVKGLKKYNLGLTNTQLTAMSFQQIIDKLNSSFGGSNAAYLNSYAGKMDQLAVGTTKAKEIIGKGLIEALDKLAGGATGSGVTALVNLMIKLSEWTAKFISGIGSLGGAIGLLLHGKFGKAWDMFQQGTMNPSYKGAIPSITSMVQKDEQKKAAAKALKNQQDITRELNKQNNAKKAALALAKQQAMLDKASAVLAQANKIFDNQAIELAAAAQGKLTEEERVRVKLKQDILGLEEAIQNNNVQAAASYSNAIVQDSQKLQILRGDMESLNFIDNPFNAWLETIRQMAAELAKLANLPIIQSSSYAARGGTGIADYGGAAYQAPVNPYAGTYYGATGRDMPSNLNIVVTGGDALTQQLRFDLIDSSLSGSQSALSRNVGSFSV